MASEREAEKQRNAKTRDSYLRQGADLFEKRVSEGIGIDFGGAKGDDAVQLIKQHIEALSSQSKAVDPKDEKGIRESKAFRDEQLAAAKKHADIVKEYETKLTQQATDFQRKETLRTVKGDMLALMEELNADLPPDPKVKANQLRLIDSYLEGAQFVQEGEGWTVLDKDGEAIKNAQGYPIKYTDFLKEGITSNFPLKASKEKTTAGDITKGSRPTGSASGTLKKPATKEDLAKARGEINALKDASERMRLHKELDELVKVEA